MNKNSIKKWILGLCSALMLTLVVGFSLPKTEAKALSADEYNIYDYSWANFFDISKLDYQSYTAQRTLERVSSPSGNAGFKVTFLDNHNSGHVILDDSIFSGSLASLTDIGTYTVLYNIFDTNIVLEDDSDFIALSFYFSTDKSTPWGNADYSGSQIFVSNVTYKSMLYLDCFVSLSNGQRREMTAGEYVCFSEVRICFGQANWADYTPYFYSLETLPDIDDGNGDSGNSGSGSGGSITPDVPDVPIVNGSYQEGFLAGLAQAQYGIFSIASFKLHIANSMEHNVSEIFDVEPDYIYGGLDFSSVYRNYHQNYPDINYCFLTISFSSPISLSSLDLLSYGESSLFYYRQSDTGVLVSRPWYLTLDTVPLSDSLLWRNSNVWGDLSNALSYQSIPISSTGYFDKIQTFTFSSLSSLNGFKLLVSNNEYSAGFDVGSSSVNTDSYDKGYEYGYNVGNNVGYNTGYYDGHKAGLSEDPYGFVDFAYSLIDMPGRIIYNWLNFDFLGINLAGLVASIITLIVVSFVLKVRL